MSFPLDKYVKKPSEASAPDQIMIMGPYGGGKTYLAASSSLVPELQKVLILDLEGSTTGTVSDFSDQNLDIINIKKQARDNGIHPVEFFEAVLEVLWDNEDHYGTVVIDTLDVLNEMYIDYHDKNADQENGTKNHFYKWTKTREVLTSSNGLIARLKDANFLSILVMHEEVDDTSGAFDFSWTGKGARSDLGQFPDLVMRVNRKYNQKKKIWNTEVITAPTERGQAKSRYTEKIPPVIESDVTMAELWDMITDTETTERD